MKQLVRTADDRVALLQSLFDGFVKIRDREDAFAFCNFGSGAVIFQALKITPRLGGVCLPLNSSIKKATSELWDTKVNSGGWQNEGRRADRTMDYGLNGKASTYFFHNFPEHMEECELWKMFRKKGHVVDVFIPRKRSTFGKKFGFVRFLGIHDQSKLVEELNDIWLGNYRLRVNVAKYNRSKRTTHLGKETRSMRGLSGSLFCLSFADVVKGKSPGKFTGQAEATTKDDDKVISLNFAAYELRMLEGALAGECKNFDYLKNLVTCFQEEGWGDLKLSFIGGLSVCISFRNNEEAERFLVENKDIWSYWFSSSMGKWRSTGGTRKRLALVSILGLPSFLLSKESCSIICKNWGQVISGRCRKGIHQVADEGKKKVGIQELSSVRSFTKLKKIADPCSCRDSRGRRRSCDHVNLAGMVVGEPILGDKSQEESTSLDECIPFSNNRNWAKLFEIEKEGDVFCSSDQVDSPSSEELGLNLGFAIETYNKSIGEPLEIERRRSGQMPKILSININGIGDKLKRRWIRGLRKEYEANIFFIQETHVNSLDCVVVRDIWGSDCFDSCSSASIGRSGGLCLIWDCSFFTLETSYQNSNFVAVLGRWAPLGAKCGFINIYAPSMALGRAKLWDDLLRLINNWKDICWVLGGDFNEVRRLEERKGSAFSRSGAATFNEFIATAGLIDPPLGGRKYTWVSADGTKGSKLDRFLFSEKFAELRPNTCSLALPRLYSDHCPIILDCGRVDFGPIPFRFFNSWLRIDSLDEVVRINWSVPMVGVNQSTHIQRLGLKLKRLKSTIKVWKSEMLREKNVERDWLNDRLKSIDLLIDSVCRPNPLLSERALVIEKLTRLDSMELEDVKQRAKCKWIRDGDENSKYFHGLVNHKRRNAINGLLINGVWEAKPEIIKNSIFEFFKEKFSESDLGRPRFRSNLFRKLSTEQNKFLEASFLVQEIKDAIWTCGDDKAPGPDGFSFAFVKKYWDLIGTDFVAAVNHFEKASHFLWGYNDSFISVVPKSKDPLNLSDYRPIHLVGCICKVISKVMASRLSKVIGSVISLEQTAYVKGRNIMDGPLIMGFGKTWIAWVKGLIGSARVSVLVNGSPTPQFPLQKGVRQGDPLSPYLFIIAVEGLIAALKDAVAKGLIIGVNLPGNGTNIASLHFADDAIFMGKWDDNNISNLMKLLRCFHKASGLKVNWCKSTLTGTGVSNSEVARLAMKNGCKEGKIPFVYLGMPIGGSMHVSGGWKSLLEKFDKRNTLSIGGRLTLCKSVLGGLGVYLFSLFKAPMKVISMLERLRKNFFWGIKDGSQKINWVAWSKTINSLESGGLGIGSLYEHNMALLAKWWWRFKTEHDALWKKVITALHGSSGGLGEGKRSGVWGKIANINTALEEDNIPLSSLFLRKLGNGKNTYFWTDLWCGNISLKTKFPRLAALEKNIGCQVADRLLLTVEENNWNWEWRRALRSDRECGQLQDLKNDCSSIRYEGGEDRWTWRLESAGNFTVSSLRAALDDMTLKKGDLTTRWNNLVPRKVRIHFSRTRMDRVPTKKNLTMKGIHLDSVVCVLCKGQVEDRDHIFATSPKSTEVRRAINKWWSDAIPEPADSLLGVLGTDLDLSKSSKREVIKDAIVQSYTWVVWKARNEELFNGKPFCPLRAANDIHSLVFSWVSSRSKVGFSLTWYDWSCNPGLI
ncbi:LOW QUALITY PROTEIN: hypothetical protein OSB04_013263 [Centaurea solstitialis]|uniref:RRM domain-containing protein n=1 Tax=Centaurea solstitialis TaxID=347529 RepID=A0AA38WQI4_9ASTR|nr:LOW QUALITY PROTEIN: hypothetical protein OSB04_013263 [Centaurea solstitialis]